MSVAELLADLPERGRSDELLPAEIELEEQPWSPIVAMRLLALGALRLDDLEGPTLRAFVGTDTSDLGPRWVAGRLDEWRADHVEGLARELAAILVRRAKRVALSKMRMQHGRPWIPSRLRDRDGLLSVHGEEGAGAVSLRTWSLAEVLAGVGAVRHRDDYSMVLTALGRTLHDGIA
jgi:hypothetical protein